MSELTYEVETRVYFNSDEEAFSKLPFLKDSLTNKMEWVTYTYSPKLFKDGSLLRASKVYKDGNMKAYLGYKEPDTGSFCNIRVELDEDITEGAMDSTVLKAIGGKAALINSDNMDEVLASLGHEKFMTFKGHNLTGYNAEYNIALKLMYCDILQYPILLEIEKSAGSTEEALKAEGEIRELVEHFGIKDRVVRKEPPTLLYDALFKTGE